MPARNTIFLSLRWPGRKSPAAEAIVIGVNALDYSGYPDCRPNTWQAFARLASLATRAGVEGRPFQVLAPLLHLSKADIIRLGLELGLDYGLTHSCYAPTPEGRACGHCDSCRLRAKRLSPRPVSEDPPNDMTERLYYTDPALRSLRGDGHAALKPWTAVRWSASIARRSIRPPAASRSTSARSANARVIDVVDEEDGDVIHVVEGAIAAGDRVAGRIDWSRRFDHMQQHTGQHVLSAAFDTLLNARTESFHLGADYATIDLARELSAAEIARAEDDANRVVWEDRPVQIRFVRCRGGGVASTPQGARP